MTPRRDLTLAVATLVVVLGVVPAYARVFAAPDWRAPSLAAAALAVLLAAVVRRLGRGALVSTTVSLLGLAVFTLVVHLPVDGLLPGPEQLGQVVALAADALEQIEQEPAPAPVLGGLLLLVTTGFWLVALLVHELLVRWSRPGLALVPAVVLWVVPLAVPQPDPAGWPTALAFLVAAGVALLLGADAERTPGDRLPSLSGAGLGIGTAALALAVLAPGVLPGYGTDAWVDLASSRDPQGYQPIVDVTERLRLPEERDLLRVRTRERTYLRLAGLQAFDGGTWRLGPAGQGSYQPEPEHLHATGGALPPEAPVASSTTVEAEVEVLDLENIYVPVPYQPRRVTGPDSDEMVWSTEGGFLATWATTDGETAEDGEGEPRVGVREGLRYEVVAERPSPDIDALRAHEASGQRREELTRLPADYPELATRAQEVYAAAGAETDVDKALALQSWFAEDGGFTYDLDVPALRADDALRDFVLSQQRGYCEYFATGMAVMLRASGVPARVAVGFLPGRVTEEAAPEEGRELTEFTVSTADAHAWVEVYFPEQGWITFEPTPRADQTELRPRPDDLAPTRNELERQRDPEAEDEAEPDVPAEPETPEQRPETETSPPTGLDEGPAESSEPEGPLGGGTGRLLAVAVALLVLAATLVARGRRRRPAPPPPGPAGAVVAAQRALVAAAARYGVGRAPAETFRETVARWRAEGRIDEQGTELARLHGAAAFGGRLEEEQARRAEQLATELRGQLRASVPALQRWLGPVRGPARAGVRLLRRVTAATRVRRRHA